MQKNEINENKYLIKKIFNTRPFAYAKILGKENDISGKVEFYPFQEGIVVVATIHNLPKTQTNIFAFHIHEFGDCEGDLTSAGSHYGDGEHPNHKGDMPPLFSNDGNAFFAFYTNRFTVEEIVGKSVIIHIQPDDFKTQPSGDSGERIACGIIEKF